MAAVMSNAHKWEAGPFQVFLFGDFAHSLGGGWGVGNEHYLVTKVRM